MNEKLFTHRKKNVKITHHNYNILFIILLLLLHMKSTLHLTSYFTIISLLFTVTLYKKKPVLSVHGFPFLYHNRYYTHKRNST